MFKLRRSDRDVAQGREPWARFRPLPDPGWGERKPAECLSRVFFRPSRAGDFWSLVSHGLRHGPDSFAPPALDLW